MDLLPFLPAISQHIRQEFVKLHFSFCRQKTANTSNQNLGLRIIRLRAMIYSHTSHISLFVYFRSFVDHFPLPPWQHMSRSESFAGRKTDYDVNFTNVYTTPETTCVPQIRPANTTRGEGRKLAAVYGYLEGVSVSRMACMRARVFVCVRRLCIVKWLP